MSPTLFAVTETYIQRANQGIDPILTAWRWEVPVYLFLGGLAAGLMVIGSLMERRTQHWNQRLAVITPFLSAIFLSVGMFALFLDLAYKIHVWRFYLAFKPLSPMSWGSWILMLTYPTLILWWLGSVTPGTLSQWTEKFPWLERFHRFFTWSRERRSTILTATTTIGVFLGIYTGILLQTLFARPLWNSSLLGPLFLTSGISTAAAFLLLLAKTKEAQRSLLFVDIAALGAEFVLLGLFILAHMSGVQSQTAAIKLLVAGPFTGAFFGLVVLGGVLTPLFLEWGEFKGKFHSKWMAPSLVLMGGIALRVILVAAGQIPV